MFDDAMGPHILPLATILPCHPDPQRHPLCNWRHSTRIAREQPPIPICIDQWLDASSEETLAHATLQGRHPSILPM